MLNLSINEEIKSRVIIETGKHSLSNEDILIPFDLNTHFNYRDGLQSFLETELKGNILNGITKENFSKNGIIILRKEEKTMNRLVVLASNILKLNILNSNKYYYISCKNFHIQNFKFLKHIKSTIYIFLFSINILDKNNA
jgi:hypothetical protein